VIVSTGTGGTGWALSINLARASALSLPAPTDRQLVFFVREAFPSRATGTSLSGGLLVDEQPLEFLSEMNQGGVVFGDGIEDDRLPFPWGQRLTIAIANKSLNLVTE
jgi:hypothetical protein